MRIDLYNHLRQSALFITLICLGFAAAAASATAATRTFDNPTYKGNRLDWCLNWAKGCGKAAADAYCKYRGYQKARRFSQASDIGKRHPTRLIGTGAVCDQRFCDGFRRIICFKPTPTIKTFRRPKWRGNRLDWCLHWARDCGKPAANAYCRKRGFDAAVGFRKASNIGDRHPTRLITSGAVCDGPGCDGFRFIRCQKN